MSNSNVSGITGAMESHTAPTSPPTTRCRITYATQRTLAYVSVLDLGGIWERSLRRAGVPVQYSQGYNQRPKFNFAAPLPVGCGGEAELMDVYLSKPCQPHAVVAALQNKTPKDLIVKQAMAVPLDIPPLSEQLVAAEYRVWLRDVDQTTAQEAVTAFLASESVPMAKRGRKHRGRTYDLRPLVQQLHLAGAPPMWVGLELLVSARPGATGRPDEVLKAIGFADVPRRCTRTQLILNSEG